MDNKILQKNVTEDESDIRLDRWFKRHFPELGHGMLQRLLRTGQIRVDGKRAEASTRLAAGQIIRIPPMVVAPVPAAVDEKRQARERDRLKSMILYEDDDVLVLNKPAGLAVQGGTGLRDSIDDRLRAYISAKGEKPKLVHRLDRDTSGVLLVARTGFAATRLTAAFRDRATRKIYWALTQGVPKPTQGRIETSVIKVGEVMQVDTTNNPEAKKAISLYQVAESIKGQASFVVLSPITGRTHQLRVHMAHIGTPIWGDPLYGKEMSTVMDSADLGEGLHLHARRLIIPHPRKGTLDVKAPLSPAMKKSWSWFGFDEQDTTDLEGF